MNIYFFLGYPSVQPSARRLIMGIKPVVMVPHIPNQASRELARRWWKTLGDHGISGSRAG
jgi:hypothetical protein